MTSKEIVIRAVEHRDPPRVPIFMFNRDYEKSDILMISYDRDPTFRPRRDGENEWGYIQESVDRTMGQVTEHPIANWSDFDAYRPPDAAVDARYERIRRIRAEQPDRYLIGNLGISGFSAYTFLRGFAAAMEDFYLEEENANRLLDRIFSFEETAIERMLQAGADAISFYDDWGSQRSLLIGPEMWNRFFRERYRRQFELIKRYGKHVFFHSCGYVLDIIPSLIELGADIFNFNGLEVMGLENVARFRGQAAFCCPVDLQSVAIGAPREVIFDYTRRMIERLGTEHGGYIGYIEEYSSIGFTERNYWDCYDAYVELGDYHEPKRDL